MSDPNASEFLKTYTDSTTSNSTVSHVAIMEVLTERFNIMECIGETAFGETYLLSEKNSEELYVLKTQKDIDAINKNEAELLGGLKHIGLPEYENTTGQDVSSYSLRKYIEGEPLSKYLSQMETADPMQAVNVMIYLCDVLGYLHSQPEPIIHRDIKPSNIIYNPEADTVKLIDFGISRKFSETSDADTTYFGTHKFAPPEQYGFAQTDCRSDIYSLGVVLRYWLTGKTDANVSIGNRALARIVTKCTELDPKKRYQSVAALKRALLGYKNRKVRFLLTGAASVFIAFMIVTSVYAIYIIRTNDNTQAVPPGDITVSPTLDPTIDPGANDENNDLNSGDIATDEPQPFLIIDENELTEFAENGESSHLLRSGNPVFLYIDGEGLRITNRLNTGDSIAFRASSLPPGMYVLEVEMAADELTQFIIENNTAPHGFMHMSGTLLTYELVRFDLEIVDNNGVNMAYVNTSNSFDARDRIWSYQENIRMSTIWVGENIPYPDLYILSIRIWEE